MRECVSFCHLTGDANTSHSSSDSSYAPANRSVRAPGAHGGNAVNNSNANMSTKYNGRDYDEFDF